jgi:hypothetical protein
MATTTNYGWDTPDDTDLVKDGAAAIRTLGSSVDTTVKALNPGTTSGDLDYYTASTTKARIAAGTAGQVFTMNSGATAPEWQTLNAGGMTLLSTTTMSTNSVTVSGISGSYNSLLVLFRGVTTSANGRVRVAPNGTTNISNTISMDFNGGSTAVSGAINDYLQFVSDTASSSSQFNMILDIENYSNATAWKPFIFGGGTALDKSISGAGQIKTNSAITSLVFSMGTLAHTFTGGSVLIYGVK